MKLSDLATGSDWIVWIVFVIFAVFSIILLSGQDVYKRQNLMKIDKENVNDRL